MAKKPSLEQRITALGDLSRAALVDLWIGTYGHPPPSGVRQPLLIRAAAWHLQQKHLGGYPAATRQLLNAAVRRVSSGPIEKQTDPVAIGRPSSEILDGETTDRATGKSQLPGSRRSRGGDRERLGGAAAAAVETLATPRQTPAPGARLLREWNGRRHVVDVTERGFVYEGVSYRSLSAIARRITGAHWSGPRFFGL